MAKKNFSRPKVVPMKIKANLARYGPSSSVKAGDGVLKIAK